jgi:multidrug efflux pump subunit AcrA (membrane-fusion protein)
MRLTIIALAALLLVTTGCQQSAPPADKPAAASGRAPRTEHPKRQTVRHPIIQPGFNVEPFQETSLYARVTGYVGKWDFKTDIGKHVKKGDVLAEVAVPELAATVAQKKAAVKQARAQVLQAQATELNAKALLARSQSQYERLERTAKDVLTKENLEEARLGYESAKAGVAKAAADVAAAEAQVDAAEAAQAYAEVMLNYAKVVAPFDGVITQRNTNEGTFVQPAGQGGKAAPLFVVSQTDTVRVFVNLPGSDAPWVKDGDEVHLLLQGAGGDVIKGNVTRNARSLDPKTRTLRTEIDLDNRAGKLLPGMYVQASLVVEHPNVWTLPAAAVVTEGNLTYCYRVEKGKAVRTPLQVGLTGGGLVELVRWQARAGSPGREGTWQEFTGEEDIVASDPVSLTDGQEVRRP